VSARRRRAAVLLALALASAGLAASQVRQRERSLEARVGPLVPVVVATRDLPADSRLRRGALALRRVPASYAPPDALAGAAGLAGARTAAAVVAGGYLTAGHLRDPGPSGGQRGAELRRGERALEVAVSGGGALAGAAPGARVDVIVSTERSDGAGRTFVALEDVELLGLKGAETAGFTPEAERGDAGATALATLRVTLRQAVYLTAAENFGRELRLLVRPPGDRGRSEGATTAEGEL
jgi:pilus assembly protein CpaB